MNVLSISNWLLWHLHSVYASSSSTLLPSPPLSLHLPSQFILQLLFPLPFSHPPSAPLLFFSVFLTLVVGWYLHAHHHLYLPLLSHQEACLQCFTILRMHKVKCTAIALLNKLKQPTPDQIHLVKHVIIELCYILGFQLTLTICNLASMYSVCVLLLAIAATKQPPLVTKLWLTNNRHFNQSQLLMSSTQ